MLASQQGDSMTPCAADHSQACYILCTSRALKPWQNLCRIVHHPTSLRTAGELRNCYPWFLEFPPFHKPKLNRRNPEDRLRDFPLYGVLCSVLKAVYDSDMKENSSHGLRIICSSRVIT